MAPLRSLAAAACMALFQACNTSDPASLTGWLAPPGREGPPSFWGLCPGGQVLPQEACGHSADQGQQEKQEFGLGNKWCSGGVGVPEKRRAEAMATLRSACSWVGKLWVQIALSLRA